MKWSLVAPLRHTLPVAVALAVGFATTITGCGTDTITSPTEPRKTDVEPQAVYFSYIARPFCVDEHWRDPNNPSSGEHVVLFFTGSCTMSRPMPTMRFYNGEQTTWLSGWMLWQRYGAGCNASANCQVFMLFANGWRWTALKATTGLSAEALAARFQLAW